MAAFDKLPAGSLVTGISLTAYNRLMDMLRWWQTQAFQSGAGDVIRGAQDACIFDVVNNSGSAQPWGGILGIDSPAILPANDVDGFRQKPIFNGVTPAVPTHIGKWVVLLDAVPSGGMCPCAAAGVVPVQVFVNATTDQYCDVPAAQTAGSTTVYLSTGASGAEILWLDPSATVHGIYWAVVRLGEDQPLIPFMLSGDGPETGGTDAYLLNPDGSPNTSVPMVKVYSSPQFSGYGWGCTHGGGTVSAPLIGPAYGLFRAGPNGQNIVATMTTLALVVGTTTAEVAPMGTFTLSNPIGVPFGQRPTNPTHLPNLTVGNNSGGTIPAGSQVLCGLWDSPDYSTLLVIPTGSCHLMFGVGPASTQTAANATFTAVGPFVSLDGNPVPSGSSVTALNWPYILPAGNQPIILTLITSGTSSGQWAVVSAPPPARRMLVTAPAAATAAGAVFTPAAMSAEDEGILPQSIPNVTNWEHILPPNVTSVHVEWADNTGTDWIVCRAPEFAKRIIGTCADAADANAAYTLSSLSAMDEGVLPADTIQVQNYGTSIDAGTSNVVVETNGQWDASNAGAGQYRTIDADCPGSGS